MSEKFSLDSSVFKYEKKMFYFNSIFYYAVLHGLFASTESAVSIIWILDVN